MSILRFCVDVPRATHLLGIQSLSALRFRIDFDVIRALGKRQLSTSLRRLELFISALPRPVWCIDVEFLSHLCQGRFRQQTP